MPFQIWRDTPTLLSFALVYQKIERLKNDMSDNESENTSSQAPVAGPSKQETVATSLYSYVPSNFQVPAPVVFQRESCSQLGRFWSSTWSGQTKVQGTIDNFTLSDGKRLSSKSQRTSMNERVGKLLKGAMHCCLRTVCFQYLWAKSRRTIWQLRHSPMETLIVVWIWSVFPWVNSWQIGHCFFFGGTQHKRNQSPAYYKKCVISGTILQLCVCPRRNLRSISYKKAVKAQNQKSHFSKWKISRPWCHVW